MDVSLEVGSKKVFACALDWPGWCRSGKGEDAALEALAAYEDRYRAVAREARVRFPAAAAASLDVVERVKGSATTDFGAPGEAVARDAEPLTRKEAQRQVKLVRAAWAVFDEIVAVTPPELRKGPRGGGRDRDKMVDHVLAAEVAYARTLGVRHPQPAVGDSGAVSALREAIAEVLGRPNDGAPLREKGWLPRYAARRIAWHVLDHAWEMQDRTEP